MCVVCVCADDGCWRHLQSQLRRRVFAYELVLAFGALSTLALSATVYHVNFVVVVERCRRRRRRRTVRHFHPSVTPHLPTQTLARFHVQKWHTKLEFAKCTTMCVCAVRESRMWASSCGVAVAAGGWRWHELCASWCLVVHCLRVARIIICRGSIVKLCARPKVMSTLVVDAMSTTTTGG